MMRPRAVARMLPDERRLHLQDGPIDLILEADGRSEAVREAYNAAANRFATILDELCSELPLLRTGLSRNCARPKGAIALKMFEAVWPYGERCFLTPMAAVAGAVAEAVLEAMMRAAELRRAYVNNGGDIALHLASGERYTIGMVDRPDRPSLFGKTEVSSEDAIRGIATSGWRGRSFSLGIADVVTVLAERAAMADAAATVIANAIDLPGHESIRRERACDILPDSDLGERLVTRGVGELAAFEIEQALDAGEGVAAGLLRGGLIGAAALSLQGARRVVSPCVDKVSFVVAPRMAEYA